MLQDLLDEEKLLDPDGARDQARDEHHRHGQEEHGDGGRVAGAGGEERDGALVALLVGVVVHRFMQTGQARHRHDGEDVQQQRDDNRAAVAKLETTQKVHDAGRVNEGKR